MNWKRASMAGALGYHSTDPDRGARLCFRLKPGSYDTAGLIEVPEQVKAFYRGEHVVLVWDGLSAHWSRAMRAWVAEQDWLTLERLPAYTPELNPVELLWSSLKKRELANLAGDHLADVATEQGIHRALVDSLGIPRGAVELGQNHHQLVPGKPTCFGVNQLQEGGRQRQQCQRVHPRVNGPSLHLDTARIDDLVELDAPRQVQAGRNCRGEPVAQPGSRSAFPARHET
ncbi:transposase [Streptomyces massasporeus]